MLSKVIDEKLKTLEHEVLGLYERLNILTHKLLTWKAHNNYLIAIKSIIQELT